MSRHRNIRNLTEEDYYDDGDYYDDDDYYYEEEDDDYEDDTAPAVNIELLAAAGFVAVLHVAPQRRALAAPSRRPRSRQTRRWACR